MTPRTSLVRILRGLTRSPFLASRTAPAKNSAAVSAVRLAHVTRPPATAIRAVLRCVLTSWHKMLPQVTAKIGQYPSGAHRRSPGQSAEDTATAPSSGQPLLQRCLARRYDQHKLG